MTNYNLALEFESFLETGIELSSAQVDRAVELSDRLLDSERQWQTYLNALALFGFETWLAERDDSLVIDDANCSVMQPSYANYIDGVFNLTVGEYKICLLTNGVVFDEAIAIDRAVIDLPEYASHFYVLVNVVEEQAEVSIERFISYEEIIRRKQTVNLTADADWTYQIPWVWFNTPPDDLLLCLRCLSPSVIPIPATTTAADNILSQLEPLIPRLQSGAALQEVLNWSQAAPILSNPELLDWLYELQTTQPTPRTALAGLRDRLNTAVAEVTQSAINVKSWLSNELDELAQNLAWTLLPAPALAPSGLRDLQVVSRETPAEEFEAIITQLRDSGEEIPETARGACQDFNLANHELRLFAVTWEIEETPGTPEWTLLLVLGAKPNNYLPQGLKLELAEGDTVLDDRLVAEDTADSYIYIQAIGELEEQFSVRVILTDGTTFTFPSFAFN
ncbi:DUF1822 family protein [Pleurocapsales cyanobacterium LEGE 10410]|nr:DUF1822 family protein [Pleurocapsales cyanobacterium LEGE 10410]